MSPGPIPLDAWDLAAAAGLVFINGLLSVWLGLRLEWKLMLASLRTLVQLLLLGMILMPIFAWTTPYPVLVICVVMVGLATHAAVGRSSRRYKGIRS